LDDLKHPLVIKVGGALLDEPEKNLAVIDALVALHHGSTVHGAARHGGVVLVHGGGLLVDRHLARLGVVTERVDGIRVTPPDVVEEIVGVLAGRVNTQLIGLLASAGAAPVGLSLSDPGAVGEITGGDPALVRTLLGGGFMPVVSSIGLDDAGGFLNINADDAAAAIAGIVRARELVLLTDVPGVLDADGRVIASLDRDAIERHISDGIIKGGMIAKVRGALDAAERSGVPVTIASWKNPASVNGVGTSTRILPLAAGAAR